MAKTTDVLKLNNLYRFYVYTVDNDKVVMKNEQEIEICCDRALLPPTVKEGDCFCISFETEEELNRRLNLTAKEILRELLKEN